MLTPHATGLQMNNTLSSKLIAILLCLPMLTACSLTEERKSEDNLKSGDTIILKKDLTTPRGEYHIKFQHGEIKQKIKHFSNNCIIETRYKGPVTFTAGPYTVTQVYYGEEFFSDGGATIEYATTFNLETQAGSGNDKKKKRFKLRCKVLDGTMAHHNFPIPDIKQVMGDFMDFNASASTSTPEQPPDQSSSNPDTASP